VLNYLLFAWMTRTVAPARPFLPPRPGLSVDVFIPTYNEDLDVLEATITGAVGIRYPHLTWVLDDGRRPEVEALARRLGADYLTRPDNLYHKAGNLNHALKHTTGEFIAILDADMVPQPDYLDRTLGYFEDEKLAFVQMPQEFYNQDSIQHDPLSRHWHEQTLFFRVIQPGKNHTNSAFWTGSPSVMRRKSLEDIGGVATETVRAVIERRPAALPEPLAAVYRFAESVVTATYAEGELRERVRKEYGERGLVEMALGMASCRVFPVAKRALGYAVSCSKVQIEV